MKSLKVKIALDSNQELILNTLSNEHRLLYNHLLNYVKTHDLNFKEINEQYKLFRKDNSLTISSKSSQNTSLTLIESIKSYLTLKKKDKNARFPYRFKSYKYFTTFMLDNNNGGGGFKIKDNCLSINLLSSKHNAKRLIVNLPNICNIINESNIKTITFKKEGNDYFICFTYAFPEKVIKPNDNFLSIDPGVKNIATGFTNVGDYFKIKNKTFKSLEKQIEQCQSRLDKKKKGSNHYRKLQLRFRQLKRKLSDCNKDFQHKTSKTIVDYCVDKQITKVIIGDIKTKSLVKGVEKMNSSPHQKKGLNFSEQNRGTLSRFQTFIKYKSVNEGIDFYKQNEAYTSKTNCLTNKLFDFEVDLSVRQVELKKGLIVDRDLNGSINIGKKAKVAWFNQIDLEEYIRKINRMYLVYN